MTDYELEEELIMACLHGSEAERTDAIKAMVKYHSLGIQIGEIILKVFKKQLNQDEAEAALKKLSGGLES